MKAADKSIYQRKECKPMAEKNDILSNNLDEITDIDELKNALLAEREKNAELEAKEALRKAEVDLQAMIAEEPSINQIREKIFVRRSRSKIPEVVPAKDVIDELELGEKKRAAKDSKRLYIGEKELKAYQKLKAGDLEPAAITYAMVEEEMKNKSSSGEQGEANSPASVSEGGEGSEEQ